VHSSVLDCLQKCQTTTFCTRKWVRKTCPYVRPVLCHFSLLPGLRILLLDVQFYWWIIHNSEMLISGWHAQLLCFSQLSCSSEMCVGSFRITSTTGWEFRVILWAKVWNDRDSLDTSTCFAQTLPVHVKFCSGWIEGYEDLVMWMVVTLWPVLINCNCVSPFICVPWLKYVDLGAFGSSARVLWLLFSSLWWSNHRRVVAI
jgi:hypothetical protein